MAVQPWRTGKIIRIQEEAPETLRFWFQADELEKFDFLPGQFVTLDLPIHENPTRGGEAIPSHPGPMAAISLNSS